MNRIFIILLASAASLSAAKFELGSVTVAIPLGSGLQAVAQHSMTATPLPSVNGLEGFKLSGTAAAGHNGGFDCGNCGLEVAVAGTVPGLSGDLQVPLSWSFRVDEFVMPAQIVDGTSNTILFAESLPSNPAGACGITDGTSNTILFGETGEQCLTDGASNTVLFGEVQRPRRLRDPSEGGISDGTANTILFGEQGTLDPRDFLYRLVMVYTSPGEPINDGTSNTIFFRESTTTNQFIASGNGYFGDIVAGQTNFLLPVAAQNFRLVLTVEAAGLPSGKGILLTIPNDSIDVNPTGEVPEPGSLWLAALGLGLGWKKLGRG